MLQLNHQTAFYQGKVRDVYSIQNEYLVMVASNRISAFDVILPKPIPFKGQVLNQLAAHFLAASKDILPNWLIDTPAPNATLGLKAKTYPVEMVVRGGLVGHAWRTYQNGNRTLCGVTMPENMKENEFFPEPILTPSTKAHEGHDEDITRAEIISRGLVSEAEYSLLEKYSLALFARGSAMAQERGLILVDTKYEFGKIGATIYLIDEIHTPDSSRYFYADTYKNLLEQDLPQRQLSKEFVREWLIANDFQGKENQIIPEFKDEFVEEISKRYIELYEKVSGKKFIPTEISEQELVSEINNSISIHCKS
jgi:phosphoribosylaminoimidazole-succinocarboxamide synthase